MFKHTAHDAITVRTKMSRREIRSLICKTHTPEFFVTFPGGKVVEFDSVTLSIEQILDTIMWMLSLNIKSRNACPDIFDKYEQLVYTVYKKQTAQLAYNYNTY